MRPDSTTEACAGRMWRALRILAREPEEPERVLVRMALRWIAEDERMRLLERRRVRMEWERVR